MKTAKPAIAALLLCGAVALPLEAEVIVDDPDWTLLRTIDTDRPWCVHVSWFDGLIYIGQRSSSDDGAYRIDLDGTVTKVVDGDRLAGIFVDPADGDIFYSEDYGGKIFRSAYPGEPRETWVDGLHSGDDDPVGIAAAPAGYAGPIIQPGDALVVDRGNGGADGLWAFSLQTPEDEWEVVGNDSALVDGVDIAISDADVYIADAAGYIWTLQTDATLLELTTSEPLSAPAGITLDPLTGDLLVADREDRRVVRVDPADGAVSPLFSGFVGDLPWAGIDVSADGTEIVVSDNIDDAVHVFIFCDADMFPDEDCNENGRRDLCDIAEGYSADCNDNGIPDECEGLYCYEDVNNDCIVDIDDIFRVLGAWNQTGVPEDVNDDGIVNIDDLFAVLGAWGPCPI